ncbi:MAG: (Fe-S)-binding protein [Lachnospiraceae bacterium]|nr:(Fe-S)-binding protein [Lachnospiraceae bacterium]
MNEKILPGIDIAGIDMANCWFNPGCAMSIYKPYLIEPMLSLLQKNFGGIKYHDVCCHHNPNLPVGATIINNCAGCDRRFRSEYEGVQTITFWEMIDRIKGLKLPDYHGLTVSVHDSCSFRQKPEVHTAVRNILQKMNMKLVESQYSGMQSICCGSNFYSHISNEKVIEFQKKRAEQMPCTNVVVYCIGCVHSMTAGGRQPLYLPDLVFGYETEKMTNTLDEYHDDLNAYIELH